MRELVIIFILLVFSVVNPGNSYAQEKGPDLKEGSTAKATECACAKPAVTSLQSAYVSLEEDEWPSAIKACKDALDLIKALSKTCKCPEVEIYLKVAQAYSKYAEGGNYLDGEENPDCAYAIKLYDEVDSLLSASIPKIINKQLKENSTNIHEYAKEERLFVKDECVETPAKGKPSAKQSEQGPIKK